MRCPYCSNNETMVVDSREADEAVRRRRECLKCGKRFTTYERIECADMIVVKKDGRREKFDRCKLRNGLQKACEKRPISQEKIEEMVGEIEAELRKKNSVEIPSKLIGELVIKKLKKVDEVAYIRFASVYRSFSDVESFQEEVKNLKK